MNAVQTVNVNRAMRLAILMWACIATWSSAWPQTPDQSDSGARGTGLAESAPSGVPAMQLNQSAPEPLIGAGDLLDVSVFGAPEYEKQVRVSGSGEISLPMVGAVHVAGLTASQAEALLAKTLADGQLFNDPRVSVFIKEYATQGVSVLGEVQKPGIYPLLGARTLFDAISAAGGTTPKAGKVVTITKRDRPQQPETVTLAFDANGGMSSNVAVHPGDTVVVTKAGIVYVVGDVRRPSGIVMENSELTVLQAIAKAEGTNPTAALANARLIRKSADGQHEIPVDLKKILQSKAPDLQLRPNDILFVPNSAAKTAGKRGIEAVLQTVTGIAIYGRY